MKTLHQLQRKILSAIITDEVINLDADFQVHKKLPSYQQLQIYKNNMTASLIRILRDIYRVVYKLVGEDFFNAMAHIYVDQTPSHSFNIIHYGASFSQFIKTFPHTQTLPYLSDVAALDWAWHTAYYAENSEDFNVDKLACLSEEEHERIVFKLIPGSTLLQSIYPVHSIWKMNQDEQSDHSTVIHLDEGGVNLYIWRKKLDMRIDVLQTDEWEFLTAMSNGFSLGELCKIVHRDVVGLLEKCVRNGWVEGIKCLLDHPHHL